MIMKEWVETWINLKAGHIAPRTLEQYNDLLSRFILPKIGSKDLEDISPLDIEATVASAKGHERTAQLIFILIKAVLSDAFRLEIIDKQPTARLRKPAHKPEITSWWTADQFRNLIVAAKDDKYIIAWILAGLCGLRRGEIAGLRWADVVGNEIHIQRQRQQLHGATVDRELKTQSSRRIIPVSELVEYFLKRERERYPHTVYVVHKSNEDPICPKTLDQAWRRLQDKLAIPKAQQITLHGLRHTMASIAIEAGASVKELQPALGHADYQTTANIYAHVLQRQAFKAVLAVSRAVLGPDS